MNSRIAGKNTYLYIITTDIRFYCMLLFFLTNFLMVSTEAAV